jgi:hypothetical protein
MEFHHMHIDVYFRLLLQTVQAGVEIDYISFEGGDADAGENTRRLIEAISAARLAPVAKSAEIAADA